MTVKAFIDLNKVLLKTISIAFVCFVAGAIIVFLASREMLKAAATEVKGCAKLKEDNKGTINAPKTEDKLTLLLTKKINDFEISSFLVDQQGLPNGTFVVGRSYKEKLDPTYTPIISVTETAFFTGKLFEVVGEDILLINSVKNEIEVYTPSYIESTQYGDPPERITRSFNGFVYKESIPKISYRIGTIYSIECIENNCKIGSAFHQESGCRFELDLSTKTYSVPVCNKPAPDGGQFTPEKIQSVP